MPVPYLASLTAKPRTPRANLHLGILLALVAGALNAGGFLAVGQYTSHMTGIVSAAADQLVLGNLALYLVSAISFGAFVAGAASTAVLVNHARRSGYPHVFSRPLMAEAVLVLLFGAMGAWLDRHEFFDVSLTVVLLCYTMGLQNALITKISRAEIRTTHVTGLVTDFGIEVGKLLYWNRSHAALAAGVVRANRDKLQIHILLIGAFFFGGVAGGYGFLKIGFGTAIPMAVVLALVALAPRVWRAQ